MKRAVVFLLLVSTLLLTGCASTESGDREFIPGQGWVPTK